MAGCENEESENLPHLAWNDKRGLLRSASSSGTSLRISQQKCTVENCSIRLVSLLEGCKAERKREKLAGLVAILETLLLPSQGGFMRFDDAYELYSGFNLGFPDQEHFRDELLNDQHGLPVVIFSYPVTEQRFVLLLGNGLNLGMFLRFLAETSTTDEKNPVNRIVLSAEFVHDVLRSMDTEYDRECAKVLLSADKSRSDLDELGIKPDTAVKAVKHVNGVVHESKNAELAAIDMLNSRLQEREHKISRELENINALIPEKKDHWPKKRIEDLEEKKILHEERLAEIEVVKKRESKYGKQQFKQGVKRIADKIVEENRTKHRKLGQRASRKVDSDDEEFIVKCIEDKATAHGRRHDSVLYLNHRMKTKDFRDTVNYHRTELGKKPIRSSTTIYNRSRPKNKRSLQSRRHIGKGLFCAKKPPKTEDKSNVCTHHQRCHVKNEKHAMFGIKNKDAWHFNLIISKDDKAYIRPGTDVGMTGARNQVIFQPTNEERARKLPQHDFANPKVYITPATHRFIEKEGELVGDEEVLMTKKDKTVVMVRPKFYVPSNGTTWASDYMRLRHEHPDLFEVDSDLDYNKYSIPFRKLCAVLKDNVGYFIQTNMKEDVLCVTGEPECCFMLYEQKRIQHLLHSFQKAKEIWELEKVHVEPAEILLGNELTGVDIIIQLTEGLQKALDDLQIKSGDSLWNTYEELTNLGNKLLQKISEYKLAPVKPNILELTDGGPGVGVSNFEVRFRDAEIAMLHKSDRRTRIHRATNDSGQNEAERSNACIGDALVDGGSLHWEYYKELEGLTEDEVAEMSLKEVEEFENNRMVKNAWRVAEEVHIRINGEPAPKGFIESAVSERPGVEFFYNKEWLTKYNITSTTKRPEVPGHSYFQKVEKFFEMHYERGELYMEFLKKDCLSKVGRSCNACTEWIGPESTKRTPRPFPDTSSPSHHYLPLEKTPTINVDGSTREPDDFQPRAQLRKRFFNKDIKLGDSEEIEAFSKQYIVGVDLIEEYLQHLTNIELRKLKRKQEKEKLKVNEASKSYSDYDWEKLYKTGRLKNLKVCELDKYVQHYKLTTRKLTKADKLQLLSAHISQRICQKIISNAKATTSQAPFSQSEHDSQSSSSSEESSSDDEVLNVFGGYSREHDSFGDAIMDEDSDEDDFPVGEITVNRYGRKVGSWRSRYTQDE
jgi:hypothetical protein